MINIQTKRPRAKAHGLLFIYFFTRSEQIGMPWEEKLVIPDIEVRISTDEVMRLSSQTLRYPGAITPPHRGTIRDRQLSRAVELLRRESKNKVAPQ